MTCQLHNEGLYHCRNLILLTNNDRSCPATIYPQLDQPATLEADTGRESRRTAPPRPPGGRSSGTRNPMVAAPIRYQEQRSERCGGGWQSAPDHAGYGNRSGFPERLPAANTRLESEPTPHPRIWDRPQVADQAEIGGGRSAFGHKEEAIPPTSTHAGSPDKAPCDGL